MELYGSRSPIPSNDTDDPSSRLHLQAFRLRAMRTFRVLYQRPSFLIRDDRLWFVYIRVIVLRERIWIHNLIRLPLPLISGEQLYHDKIPMNRSVHIFRSDNQKMLVKGRYAD